MEDINIKLKNFYTIARDNKDNVWDVLKDIEEFINKSFNEKEDTLLKRRGISFIALKHDILLSLALTRENIINYYNDVVRFIDTHNTYYNQSLPEVKIIECLAKIDYANMILNEPYIAKKLFEKYLLFMSDNLYRNFDKEKGVCNIIPAYLSAYLSTYSLLYGLYGETVDNYLSWSGTMHYWKYFKFEHYGYTQEEKDMELKMIDKYDIIWREDV